MGLRADSRRAIVQLRPDTPNIFDRELVRRHRDSGTGIYGTRFPDPRGGNGLTASDMARSFPLAPTLAPEPEVRPCARWPGGIKQVISSDLYQMLRRQTPRGQRRSFAFAEGAFDLIFSNLDLHWTNDLPAAFPNSPRLKPDGLFSRHFWRYAANCATC